MNNHPVEEIAVESAIVGVGIVPVVRFINGFDGIHHLELPG